MSKLFSIASALVLAACAAAAAPDTAQAHGAAPLECAIRLTPTRHGMQFEALARSGRPAFGDYEFVLTKRDRSGESDIAQSGEFELASGEERQLGGAELSLERGARYRARLVLSNGESVLCLDAVRS